MNINLVMILGNVAIWGVVSLVIIAGNHSPLWLLLALLGSYYVKSD